MILFNKYKIIEHLNNGACASVYKGENIRTKEVVAIKTENKNKPESGSGLLKREAQIYVYLGSLKGFPNVKWFGSDDASYYLVMNLLGDSLQTIRMKYQNCSLSMVKMIGIQMIQRVQSLHIRGLVHRDIKPGNFVFGLHDAELLHLIDFGFCKRYKLANNKHIPYKTTSNIIGTINFISLNVHKKIEPSRRDDLESVVYILVFLLGKMEWEKHTIQDLDTILQIIECKQNIIHVIPDCLKKMLEHIWKLDFHDAPDYNLLIGLLTENITIP